MKCQGGKCECKVTTSKHHTKNLRCLLQDMTYVEKVDALTSSISNPSQQCVKECTGSRVGRDNECYGLRSLGQSCLVQEQCPDGAGCYRGKCTCKCEYERVGNKCVVPVTTTTRTLPNEGTGTGVIVRGWLRDGCMAWWSLQMFTHNNGSICSTGFSMDDQNTIQCCVVVRKYDNVRFRCMAKELNEKK